MAELSGPKEEIYVCILKYIIGYFFSIEITKRVEKEFRQKRYFSNSNTKSGPWFLFPIP